MMNTKRLTFEKSVHSEVNKKNFCRELYNESNPVDLQSEEVPSLMTMKVNFVHITDRLVTSRAAATIPAPLKINRSGAIQNVRALSAPLKFGPVEGVCQRIYSIEAKELISETLNANKPIFLVSRQDIMVTHVDLYDTGRCNWFSLLPLGDQNTANIWLYEQNNLLYGMTSKPLAPRTTLRLGYTKEYAEAHQISDRAPVLDVFKELESHVENVCHVCQRIFLNNRLLARHSRLHQEIKPSTFKHRCIYCRLSFTRLDSLKRHLRKGCIHNVKKLAALDQGEPKKRDPTLFTTDLSQSLNVSQSSVESKLPSDESLHNFTNNLDISTNLFDISGTFKTEDFNFYGFGEKDENPISTATVKSETIAQDKKKIKKKSFKPCPLCNKAVFSGRIKQHSRFCRAQKYKCQCGVSFTSKDNLCKHVVKYHNASIPNGIPCLEPEQTFKCEKCEVVFKRRGMLVNHMWRKHQQSAAGVPPAHATVRHYPCAACPKIYRAAAKRAIHVRKHHPGLAMVELSVSSGNKVVEPAKCSECPSQYRTNAKLWQHMRCRHPDKAPPLKRANRN